MEDETSPMPSLNADDRSARERLQVALALMTSGRPMEEKELKTRIFPELDSGEGAARMRLERCWEALGEAGVVIERRGGRGEGQWSLDGGATFADADAVASLDEPLDNGSCPADFLSRILCAWARGNGSPMADELHGATAKITHSFTAERRGLGEDEGRTAKAVSTMLKAIAERHPLKVRYRKDDGSVYEGPLLPYGRNACWGRGYLVAARPSDPEAVRLWRDDRFLKVAMVEDRTFPAPDQEVVQRGDISLPFQIPSDNGATAMEVSVMVPDERYLVVREETLGKGTWETRGGERLWTVEVADLEGAITWFIDRGLEAVAPKAAVEAMEQHYRRAWEVFR